MIYEEWGFRGSPFQTTSLPASELGEKLLVGREDELNKLVKRIKSGPKMATIEGLNGIGKTSIVNVAAYKIYREHTTEALGALYIPCRRSFQLSANVTISEFVSNVYMEVAQTLVEQSAMLRSAGLISSTKQIGRWLNSPQLSTYNAGLTGGIFGGQIGAQSETNTSKGFELSGFKKHVINWLEEIFEVQDGGVLCVIDNLELLQQSDVARNLLEQLRDELFSVRGLKWVLCGSLGIVYGIVSSPRLEGFLHHPIQIDEISEEHASEILASRIDTYALNETTAYMPLSPDDFDRLHKVLRGNLRSVLSHADTFCQWVSDRQLPGTSEEKHAAFDLWLHEQCESAYEAVKAEVGRRAFDVFEHADDIGGVFSPGDFEGFGFSTAQAFRPSIRTLEGVGLLVSTQDDTDKRRKTIQITPKGWLVRNHINGM